MNDIGMYSRNRLSQHNLDVIMRIVKEGKDNMTDNDQLEDLFEQPSKRKTDL
jgi:hypothetical protein